MSTLKADMTNVFEELTAEDGPVAPEHSQDPFDAVAHEFSVAQFGKSYFEKRYENAKKSLSASLDEVASNELSKTYLAVTEQEVSQNISLMSGQHHDLTASVKIGASYLDLSALRVELMQLLPTDKVRIIMDKCTKRRAPSITYIVSEPI